MPRSIEQSPRDRITAVVRAALEPIASVLAGWEAGSAAFCALDRYSDLDLNFLITDDASTNLLYGVTESALETISPIAAIHPEPPGRYYKLQGLDAYLLVDLCFYRAGAPDHALEVERHGQIRPLFDKNDWLRPRPLDVAALSTKREVRYRELQSWFTPSQVFVRKAILRGQPIEAMTAYWAYTMRPLAELLRMRHCPERWDFGLRYLERDLPAAAYARVQELNFPRDLDDLQAKLESAIAWAEELLQASP